MIGHLGTRVSALLDGQMSPRESEEAWAHVYTCHACRDLVEREGWVKTRLAGLCADGGRAPSNLKGSLLSMPPDDVCLVGPDPHAASATSRRTAGAVAIGGGAIGAAMLSVLALGLTPGGGPPADRRPPASQINTTVPASPSQPARAPATGFTSVSTGLSSLLPVPARRMLP